MYLELIRIGGGACNTAAGLEFGLIYMNPLALHFSLNFHFINANNKGSFGQNSLGLQGTMNSQQYGVIWIMA